MPLFLRQPNTTEYALMGWGARGLSPGRLEAHGVAWQQSVFTRDFDGRIGFNLPDRSPLAFGPDDTLLAFGWFDGLEYNGNPSGSEAFSLVELDWNTGDVLARTDTSSFFYDSGSVRGAVDSQSRLVFAERTARGEIAWSRLANGTTSSVTLVRTSYALMPVSALVADAQGGSYLLTSTGDRNAEQVTLCHMSDAQDVSCVILADYVIAESLLAAEQPGVVYLRTGSDGFDGTQLTRFDFPL